LINEGLQVELAAKSAPLRMQLGRRTILDVVTTIRDSRKIFILGMIILVDVINSLDRFIIQMNNPSTQNMLL